LSSAIIIGGGLAGLSAAAALGGAGWRVDLFETRAFLGGRATSWPVAGEDSEVIDNCQHVLLRCCHNLIDFYGRLGVERKIRYYSEYFFLEPGGRLSTLKSGVLPPPMHFAGSFAGLKFLGLADKAAIARAMLSIPRERKRTDLDRITMLEWLHEKRQTTGAINRYWRQVLVSAISEELDRMAASHGLQVFSLGMMQSAQSFEMGVPDIPLRELYSQDALHKLGDITLHGRCPAKLLEASEDRVCGLRAEDALYTADHYISAVPSERIGQIAPFLAFDASPFEHSPITGIHLWFDRPVTTLPHATLLDRTIQWMYNKSDGRYLQLVVSASRSLITRGRPEIIELALRELAEFFPAVRTAKLERAQVVKEVRATFSARPGLEAQRPLAQTALPNFSLAGDWTRSGWPATMEGAVRSGYLAAEAAVRAQGCGPGRSARFLIPDAA